MTDHQKGILLIGIALTGALAIWWVNDNLFSFAYGIPVILLVWGRILLKTTAGERQETRPIFKVYGVILMILFAALTVAGTIMELLGAAQ